MTDEPCTVHLRYDGFIPALRPGSPPAPRLGDRIQAGPDEYEDLLASCLEQDDWYAASSGIVRDPLHLDSPIMEPSHGRTDRVRGLPFEFAYPVRTYHVILDLKLTGHTLRRLRSSNGRGTERRHRLVRPCFWPAGVAADSVQAAERAQRGSVVVP